METAGPAALFAIFALLSALGAYLILTHHHGRGAGLLAAALTLAFFAILGAGLLALLREAPAP
jgi:hypothetical protein